MNYSLNFNLFDKSELSHPWWNIITDQTHRSSAQSKELPHLEWQGGRCRHLLSCFCTGLWHGGYHPSGIAPPWSRQCMVVFRQGWPQEQPQGSSPSCHADREGPVIKRKKTVLGKKILSIVVVIYGTVVIKIFMLLSRVLLSSKYLKCRKIIKI